MKEILGILIIGILALTLADNLGYYDVKTLPLIGESLDAENIPLVGIYLSGQDAITLPKYTGVSPDGDDDGDGVMNTYDCCWDEPTNWLGVYFGVGCPDRDMDTIADRWDGCPDTAYNTLQDPMGCPPPVVPTPPVTPPVTPPTTPTVNLPPVANFTMYSITNVVYVEANLSTDDGNITNYLWNFGDGVIKNGIKSQHTYQSDGNKYVTLTVTDNGGLADTMSKYIAIDANDSSGTTTTGGNTIPPQNKGAKIFSWVLFGLLIIAIIVFSNPRNRQRGFMFLKGKRSKSNAVTRTFKPATKVAPIRQEKKILVHEHYRKEKSGGGLL